VLIPVPFFVPGSTVLFNVTGAPLTVDVNFTEYGFIGVEEYGLPQNLVWSASISGPLANEVVSQGPNATTSFAIVFDAPPGDYSVSAVAAGYAVSPSSVPVSVSPGVSSTAKFVFTLPPGTLALQVTPTNALVWVDGALSTLNVSGGLSVPLPAGEASVEAAAPGYHWYFTNITISSNQTAFLNIALSPILLGNLTVKVVPANAILYFDFALIKENLTTGSFVVNFVAPGTYPIVVLASGYYPYYNNVSIRGGFNTSLSVALNPISASAANSGIGTTGWILIGALAVLAVALLVGMIYFARGPRRGTGPTGPTPAQPWQETPPEKPPLR